MKRIVSLAMSLTFVASMAMAQDDPVAKQNALNQLQTLSPKTTEIGGVPVSTVTLAVLLAAIAAIIAGSNGNSTGSSSSSST
ncbi:MAG: hypothetical protein ACOH2H_05730 [Cypionkella sp.]